MTHDSDHLAWSFSSSSYMVKAVKFTVFVFPLWKPSVIYSAIKREIIRDDTRDSASETNVLCVVLHTPLKLKNCSSFVIL